MASRGRTSGAQFTALLEFMESHGDITRPQARGRARAALLWQELTSMLNSVGGGIQKTPEKWKKVWADWKSKTKKKASTIHRFASATGSAGGPRILQRLTTFEVRLLKILDEVAVEGQSYIEEQGFNNSQAIPLLETTNDDNENGPASPPSWAPPELTPQTHPPSTNHEQAQASTSREQFQASTTPTRPRSTRPLLSATSPDRPAMRPRRRRALTPFDRATMEFLAVEQRRLALEELRESNNSRRIETDAERTRVFSRFADHSQAWQQHTESTNIERTNVMSRFADLAQIWLQHYLARDNTEPLNNSQ